MKYFMLIIFCALANFCFAQITTGTVQKRAEQKVENRANQKVDKAIDKGLDALEGLFNKNKKKTPETPVENETTATPSAEKYELPKSNSKKNKDFVPSKNIFLGNMIMEYSYFKNDKEEKHSPMLIEMHLSENATAMKITSTGNPTSLMILHLDKDKITMVPDLGSPETAVEMNRPNSKIYDDSKMEIDVQKTGNKKTIDGYHCEEYIVTMDGTKSTNWITKDIDIDWDAFQKSMMTLSEMNRSSKDNYYGDMDGFPIEISFLSKNGKEKTVIKTKNIQEGTFDKSLFDLSKYNIMKIPGFGN